MFSSPVLKHFDFPCLFWWFIICYFFPSENSNTETEETACSACGLFIQEMRRQVMKLRMEGSVS